MIFLIFVIASKQTAFSTNEYVLTGTPVHLPLGPGRYVFECFGAQGGQGYDNGSPKGLGGKGAYTKGTLFLLKFTNFFINVGGKGGSNKRGDLPGGYNGGGRSGLDKGSFSEGSSGDDGSGSGGGASDIRYSDNSQNNRIMVAAGGSGGAWNCAGAYGGTLRCIRPTKNNNYAETDDKILSGIGGDGSNDSETPGSGGGGGFYGGRGGNGLDTFDGSDKSYIAVGDGGSSYVSGHPEQTTFTNIRFTDVLMYSGESSFGRSDDGLVRITTLSLGPADCIEMNSNELCTVCESNYRLYNGVCYSTCPPTTYRVNTNCVMCSPGHACSGDEQKVECTGYQYSNDLIQCKTCDSGYNPNEDHTGCVKFNCIPTEYLDPSGHSCNDCPAGSACPDGILKYDCLGIQYSSANQAECTNCPHGSNPNDKHTQCDLLNCPPSEYLIEEGHSCEICPAGYSCIGDNSKTECFGDREFSLEGASECEECTTGSEPNEDHSGCSNIKCGIGEYLDGNDCIECPIGYECNNDVKNKCINNKFSNSTGLTKCYICYELGYGVDKDNKKCEKCLIGEYGKGGYCIKCKEGTFNNLIGESNCKECGIGEYSNEIGSESCKLCERGQYSKEGASNCSFCDENCKECYYSSNNCTLCKENMYLFKEERRCVFECPEEYFNNLNNLNNYECGKCKINCKKCTNENNCNICKDDYYLFEEECLRETECNSLIIGNIIYGIDKESGKCIKILSKLFTKEDGNKNPYNFMFLIFLIGDIFYLPLMFGDLEN